MRLSFFFFFFSEGRLLGEAFSLIDTCGNEIQMIYLMSGYSYFLKKEKKKKIRNKQKKTLHQLFQSS